MKLYKIRLCPDKFWVREFDSSIWDIMTSQEMGNKDFAEVRASAFVSGEGLYCVSAADASMLTPDFQLFAAELNEEKETLYLHPEYFLTEQ
jgi:hypothetical protein